MIEFGRTPNVPWGPDGSFDMFIDIYSYLLGNRLIYVSEEINRKSASALISQILYLESRDSKNEMRIYINSPGGDMNSTLAVYDTMNYVKSPIRTLCIGECYSGASILLSAGTKGMRGTTANSIIMIHEPQTFWGGSATESEIHHEFLMKQKDRLIRVYSKLTGNEYDNIKKDIERDKYMDAEEALEYGLVDYILEEE
jgi:ATP-dependent Clp protease protease subunit